MGKHYRDEDVLTAARARIATVFDRFEHHVHTARVSIWKNPAYITAGGVRARHKISASTIKCILLISLTNQ